MIFLMLFSSFYASFQKKWKRRQPLTALILYRTWLQYDSSSGKADYYIKQLCSLSWPGTPLLLTACGYYIKTSLPQNPGSRFICAAERRKCGRLDRYCSRSQHCHTAGYFCFRCPAEILCRRYRRCSKELMLFLKP